ncbi:MAG: helix-turn-helix domain-containing protein [Rickettsiales bacterium]|nr:helix-turn-helix domain-containing protein [Rickettsiales bacterium]
MQHFKDTLAAKLRELRGDMTQREFAEKLGTTQATVNRIEQGEQNVTIDTLYQFCRRLRCTPNDLLMK